MSNSGVGWVILVRFSDRDIKHVFRHREIISIRVSARIP